MLAYEEGTGRAPWLFQGFRFLDELTCSIACRSFLEILVKSMAQLHTGIYPVQELKLRKHKGDK